MKGRIVSSLLVACVGFVTSTDSLAGIYKLTHHSRANCITFNETISWDLVHPHFMSVTSMHDHDMGKFNDLQHALFSGENHDAMITYGRRAGVFDNGDVNDGRWVVTGRHFMKKKEYAKTELVQEESVRDCSKYDGWW